MGSVTATRLHVTIGVDIGQRRDPTALAVVEAEARIRPGIEERAWRLDRPGGGFQLEPDALPPRVPTDIHYVVRHLERLPLMTAYPVVVQRLVAVAANVRDLVGAPATLYLDATGVGTPVLDELRAAGIRARLTPCYFTHGDRRTEDRGQVLLGKAWLVSRLQVLLQNERLHLPRTAEAEALGQELLDYEIKIDQDANDRYGAFRVGAHDDLVTALGLAVQAEPRVMRVL